MILHGIDVIEIERIRTAVIRYGQRFLLRVYTSTELERYQANTQSLAVRWAAKEATAKLLGVGIRGIGAGRSSNALGWKEIEVLNDTSGRPIICLHHTAAQQAEQLGIMSVSVSLSHTRELAIASVVGLVRAG
jgi:holo-[acyl-carrier protein] synthase